jgi:hypothetical protein
MSHVRFKVDFYPYSLISVVDGEVIFPNTEPYLTVKTGDQGIRYDDGEIRILTPVFSDAGIYTGRVQLQYYGIEWGTIFEIDVN